MNQPAKALFKLDDDEQWLNLLIRSVNEVTIDGFDMPRFPHRHVQERWVGSSDERALREAFNFYTYVKAYSDALGMALHSGSKMLDFGCGWGRCTRMFWNDIAPGGIHGVDIDHEILASCRTLGAPGTYNLIEPAGELPFDSATFDVIVAYSLFSHFPEPIANSWMKELSRVSKSGCVFVYNVEPRRFLDFIASLPENPSSSWHAGLARFKGSMPSIMQKFDEGRFCFLPTSGGGEYMSADVYGDAVIPEAYIRRNWDQLFRTSAYIDDPDKFWQAFVVGQKR